MAEPKTKSVVVKSVELKERENAPAYWVLYTKDGEKYSLFPKDEMTEEQEAKFKAFGDVKWGNKIDIFYTEGKINTRTGKPYLNLHDYERPIQVDSPEEGGGEKMSKGDWAAKDRRIAKEACLHSASRYHQGKAGQDGSISLDVLTDAKVFFEWVMEE